MFWKKYRLPILIANLLILLPCLAGFLAEPSAVPGLRAAWQFWLPLTSLAAFWISLFFTARASRTQPLSDKVLRLVIFSVPVISLVTSTLICLSEFGYSFNVLSIINILLGGLFIVLGNWMPKIEPNSVMGVRTSWALENRENWKYSQRMGGYFFITGGLVLLAGAFYPGSLLFLLLGCLVLAVGPMAASWYNYHEQREAGTWKVDMDLEKQSGGQSKWMAWLGIGITALVIALACIPLFTGGFRVELKAEGIQVEATLVSGTWIPYADIESVTYEKAPVSGTRIFGYGTPSLNMGTYENAELGRYTRYTEGTGPCIRIDTTDGVYVIGEKDEAETRALYEKISQEKGR